MRVIRRIGLLGHWMLVLVLICSCSSTLAPVPRELPLVNPEAKSRELPSVFNFDILGITLADLKTRYPERLRELNEPTKVEYSGQTRNVDFSGCFQFDQSGACRNPQISADVGEKGTAILAIYYVEANTRLPGFTTAYVFPDTQGVLAPILIDVCLQVSAQGDRVVPKDVDKKAHVCALQGYHHTYLDEYRDRSQTQLESKGSAPMYERVFNGIINLYGEPENFASHGKITIILPDGSRYSSEPSARYIDYHWGRKTRQINIDYAFNPADGQGTVYVSLPEARFYAQKRHDMGDVNFVLWRLNQTGGMNHTELEMSYQHGSIGQIRLDARAEKDRMSAPDRNLFDPRA